MAKALKPGDAVSWNTSQGETHGVVEKKVTKPTRVKSYVAKASPDHPEYLVKSDKSGKEAVHKASGLTKMK